MGIKNLARKLIYCPHFSPKKMPFTLHVVKTHDEFKYYVKRLIEGRFGVLCEVEKEVVLPGGEKGFVDLVCHGKERSIIAEVKSFNYLRADNVLSDLMQLLLYAYAYIQKYGKDEVSIDLFLVYKDFDGKPLFIKLNKDSMYVNFNIENEKTVTGNYRYVSPLCTFCSSQCSFKVNS
uniref:Uncharacterized protein n=1 Tax=Ignisphaera aggregans TaxID=334771 RepID=A0A7C4FA67_9CREN